MKLSTDILFPLCGFSNFMKVTEHIKHADATRVSFEILPPLKGGSIEQVFSMLDPLMEFKPPFIDVTYHREEFIYQKRPGGFYEKVAIRKRPGTVGICAGIINRYSIDAIPHLICGGFSKDETENALIDLSFLGVKNVLALRGDVRKPDDHFIPEEDGHAHALDLVRQIVDMNQGRFLHEETVDGGHADFCIGVAGYPEKHFEAPNLKSDIAYLKKKIDAGADYIVTQMFFDNQKYFDFVQQCRQAGIKVPIIPGLKPLTRKSQLNALPSTFHVNIPDDLYETATACNDEKAVRQVGIEWAIMQSRELIKAKVPILHFYTLSNVKTVAKIVSKIF